MEVVRLILSLCYAMWWARNKTCFEGKIIEPLQSIHYAEKNVEDYQLMIFVQSSNDLNTAVVTPSLSESLRWKPPPIDWYKLKLVQLMVVGVREP